MDQNNIERLSTSWINIHFSTDLLDPRLNQQDKGPSWDGEIDCYEQPGKRKKDRVGSCKVQVKGKAVQTEELEKEVISYPVEIDDLRNYGVEGGVIFFVVLIADKNQNSIYYASLLPYDIYKIMGNLKNARQMTKSIEFKRLPSGDDSLLHIVKKFIFDKEKQFGITLDYVNKLPDLGNYLTKGIPLTFNSDLNNIFTDDIYVYRKYDENIYSVIGKIRVLEFGMPKPNATAKIGNKKYFKRKIKANFSANKVDISLGSCFQVIILKTDQDFCESKILFDLKGTLDDVVEGLEFAIDIRKSKCFYLSGIGPCEKVNLNLDDEKIEKTLSFYKKIQKLFRVLHIKKPVFVEKITAGDSAFLEELYESIIDKVPINVAKAVLSPNYGFTNVAVCGLTISLIAIKDEEKLVWLDAFQTDCKMKGVIRNNEGDEFETSVYVQLKKEHFMKFSNINYEAIKKSIKEVPYSIAHCENVTNMLLELLLAYDQTKDGNMLKGATEIAIWLKNCEESETNIINYYQCILRKRELNTKDKHDLIKLKNLLIRDKNKNMWLAGIAILLKEKSEFDYYYSALPEKEKEKFDTFPIMHLL